MTEETAIYEVPPMNGEVPLPKRSAPRGLLPSTWLERTLRVEYRAADGQAQETTATLLDLYPTGAILSIAGAKTMLSWDALVLAELQEDR